MKMEINSIIKNHEERIIELESKVKTLLDGPKNQIQDTRKFIFSNKKKNHNELLEELLKSEYCHYKIGLSIEEILQIFSENGRPVVPKKIRDLLAIWKNRKKIEAIKIEGILKYFWVENE